MPHIDCLQQMWKKLIWKSILLFETINMNGDEWAWFEGANSVWIIHSNRVWVPKSKMAMLLSQQHCPVVIDGADNNVVTTL